jgi:hypothetical protein
VIERDVSDSHLDAMEATLRLGLMQLESLRHHRERLKAQAMPQVAIPELPEQCQGHSEERCGRRSDDGRVSNFGGTWKCIGCRRTSDAVTVGA